jgi:hypothetical protein
MGAVRVVVSFLVIYIHPRLDGFEEVVAGFVVGFVDLQGGDFKEKPFCGSPLFWGGRESA